MDESSEQAAFGSGVSANPRTPREELSDFIARQEGRIGDVYNLTQEGLDARAIADRLNVATQGFVYQYQAHIDAALDGKIPSGPAILKAVASRSTVYSNAAAASCPLQRSSFSRPIERKFFVLRNNSIQVLKRRRKPRPSRMNEQSSILCVASPASTPSPTVGTSRRQLTQTARIP